MFGRLSNLVDRHARAVVGVAVGLFLVSGVVGGGVADLLGAGGFDDPGSESAQASDVLEEEFGGGTPDVVLLVTARDGTVDDAEVAAAGQALTDRLAGEDDVANVISYWSAGNAAPLRSDDGRRALVLARLVVPDDKAQIDRIAELRPRFESAGEGDGDLVSVEVGGWAALVDEANRIIEEDLIRAEVLAVPLTLLLLVIVFGTVVAGLMPILVGMMSIVGTFLVLRVLSEFTNVSVFALNLTTALGLGLAIDYSLLVVARYREALQDGLSPSEAVDRTVRTAGRTIVSSALTVAVSLSALLVFPLDFLRSFAYAGVAVALLTGAFAVVVLPAIMRLLGDRLEALTVRRRPAGGGGAFWATLARVVMRHPVPIAIGVTLVLLAMVLPFLRVHLTLPDDRTMPESSDARQIANVIREDFSSKDGGALLVVADGAPADDSAFGDYAGRLAELPGVARVDSAAGTHCGEGLAEEFGCTPGDQLVAGSSNPGLYGRFANDSGQYLSVVPIVDPLSDEGEDLADAVRAAEAPYPTMVTGQSAELVDTKAAISAKLPLALGLIAVSTLVVLFLMFGSVLIPLKAIVMNLLSMSAMFGAMVWVFQDGHLSGVLGFTATGGLDATMPVLMFCVAFGLSMDYEVFLLASIKEHHDAGEPNEDAIAHGLQQTGRLVTSAAVLMTVVFMAFAVTGRVSFVKLFGVGLSLAVLMDAFVIRSVLVPAVMRLAGDWNWWAPAPLRRAYERWGIGESVTPGPDEPGSRPRQDVLQAD